MNTNNKEVEGIEEIDELVKEFKNQFGAWQTTSNQPYHIFVEWFEREIKKIYQNHHQELQKAREEERERCKSIILRRTEIPRGARNPTRDAIVILGEQLVELIDDQSELDQPNKQNV